MSEPRYQAVLESPLPGGLRVGIVCAEGAVTAIDFLGPEATPFEDSSAGAGVQAVRDYFRDASRDPVVELRPDGTPFQRRVWEALRRIPVGATRSYGDLAAELGSSPRAVAGACRRNPVPLLIPCHRVVARRGLGGFMGAVAGPGVELKRWLLGHEGI